MIRSPAVAGYFYPADPRALATLLDKLIDKSRQRRRAIGIVVPHAGYVYSGHVAGAVFSQVEIPSRTIILCPNHTGLGVPLAIMRRGAWETPLGQLEIDEEMSTALMEADPELEDDVAAHRSEHGLEVQLPFVQHIQSSGTRFVPITVGISSWDDLEQLGLAIHKAMTRIDPSALIIASSDMNHYESDAITRIKDARAIDAMLRLDPKGLYDTVRRERISMCGFGPATAMLIAARLLGARRAELVRYSTSGEVSKDFDRVVGYAGLVVGQ